MNQSTAERIASLPEKKRKKFFSSFTQKECRALMYDWEFWARPKQKIPELPWYIHLIMAGRGYGKAIPLSTPIPTPEGWTTMEDLKVGDKVLDENGQPAKVTFKTDVFTPDKAYEFTFNDGSTITSCSEHQWVTWSHLNIDIKQYPDNWANCGQSKIATTQDIVNTLYHGTNDLNHAIPLTRPLKLTNNDLAIPPYEFGYGISKGEYIPQDYLRGSKKQRLELLQGLMDTRGCVIGDNLVNITVKTSQLAKNIYELIVSLGMKAQKQEINTDHTGRYFKIKLWATLPIFKSLKKLNKLNLNQCKPLNYYHRLITIYEEVKPTPMQCITVDSPNSMYLVGEQMIPTHNTRTGAETTRDVVENDDSVERIALIGSTAGDVRDILVEGQSGILSVFPPDQKPHYFPAKRRVEFHNGKIATLYSSERPDRLRGPQHGFAWCDELAAWTYPQETWDMLQMGLRLGDNPRAVITTTPRPIDLIKEIVQKSQNDDQVIITQGSTYDNRSNLPKVFYEKIISKYEGTRLGEQELEAELLLDTPDALWEQDCIDEHRVGLKDLLPDFQRIVVSVDPAVTNNPDSDETGIIIAALGTDKDGYIIEDATIKGKPKEWARKSVNMYHKHLADFIVGEVNNGGDLVETVVLTQDENVNFTQVRASRGKAIRAEPVANLYERGKIHHIGHLPKLEDQMTSWSPSSSTSPDRVDALVWAITELMIDGTEQASSLYGILNR